MDIENITVTFCLTGHFDDLAYEGVTHVKELPYLSVVQATQGQYSFGLDGEPQTDLRTGGCFVAPALARQEITHHNDPASGRMSARWVFMDVVVNDCIPFDLAFSLPTFPDEAACRQIGAILDRMLASEDLLDKKIGCYELLKILLPGAVPKAGQDPRIRGAVAYIHHHYREHVTIEDIANAGHTSAPNLHRLFRQAMGTSPMDYCNSLKFSYACMLLGEPLYSIKEIADLCGVGDPYYFSKSFKKKFGVSPSDYRRDVQKKRAAT